MLGLGRPPRYPPAMETDKRWFKPKTHGWGFTPASWRGWAATIVFVLIAAPATVYLRAVYGRATAFEALAVLIAGFVVLGSFTGAAGWWRRIGRGD